MEFGTFYSGKSVAVTGGTGSVGQYLVRFLTNLDVRQIRVIDNNENVLFDFEQEFASDPRVSFHQCDICDEHELTRVLSQIDYCFHAAALKHVPSCERSPFSAIATNILGVKSVIRAAINCNLQRVLFTSSDKAVNPTNVMGTSKLMGERLFTASHFLKGGAHSETVFSSTRFGNVAGSRGSVVPLFARQILQDGRVTLTDRRMTRFVMDPHEAVRLLVDSMYRALGGEVFITKMPVIRIEDLTRVMVELLEPLRGAGKPPVEISEVGARPGEKLWEELSTDEESRRLLEGEEYLVVLPSIAPVEVQRAYVYPDMPLKPSTRVYHSDHEEAMTDAQIRAFLSRPGVLPSYIATELDALVV